MGDDLHAAARDTTPAAQAAAPGRARTPAAEPSAAQALVDPRNLAAVRPRSAPRIPPSVMLGLQRSHGNTAVRHLLRAMAPSPAPTTVQRCGGEVHEGCGCASGATADPAALTAPTVAEEAAGINETAPAPTAQRDGPTDPAPATDLLAIPADSPYASMAAPLMNAFKESYRNATMLMRHGDTETLVQVLDRIGMSVISIASEIYERMQARGIWSFVKDIDWVYLSTSRGMSFHSTGGGLRAAVNGSPNFCKEFVVASMAYHGTTEMWREYVTPGTPGLHIGAAEEPVGIHIDMHQVAVPLILPPGTGYCDYDPAALLGHAGDLQSDGSTVFSRADAARSRMVALRNRIDRMTAAVPDKASELAARRPRVDQQQGRLDPLLPRLRFLSTAGMEGEQQATAAFDADITAITAELDAIDGDINAITAAHFATDPNAGSQGGGTGAGGAPSTGRADAGTGGVGADDEE